MSNSPWSLSYSSRYEDEEDVLSLSDLPLYSEIDEQCESRDSSSIPSYQHEFFEFFTEEFNPPATAWDGFPPESMLFCGKLIPCKQLLEPAGCRRPENQDHEYSPRILSSNNRSQKTCFTMNRGGKGCDSPARKVSVLVPSCSGKARWYLFLFGMTRFSNEVNLGDMKNRQSRRQCASPPQHSGGRDGGRRLWWLVKALSCSGHHQTTAMVAASMSRIPPKP